LARLEGTYGGREKGTYQREENEYSDRESLPWPSNAFTSYFEYEYVQTLGFENQPDYFYLRQLFRDLFIGEGIQYEHVFDCTIKKFSMIHNCIDPPAQTRGSRRRNKWRRDLKNTPSARSPYSFPGQPNRSECLEKHQGWKNRICRGSQGDH